MPIEKIGTLFFLCALLHSFLVSKFSLFSHKFPQGSKRKFIFSAMGNIELVFIYWAALLMLLWSCIDGVQPVLAYQKSLSFHEPIFIFFIMLAASTPWSIRLARHSIVRLSDLLSFIPAEKKIIQFFIVMTVGPLLGSLMTEPAAITISAALLYNMIDDNRTDAGLRYGILALLFVNVSLGGALTAFAAPPILMVAGIWSWNNSDVFLNLGIPALIAVIGNAMIFLLLYSKKLKSQLTELTKSKTKSSFNVVESLQVALFLTGLIEFGALQKWWLAPLLGSLSEHLLYSGSVVLTAAIDNAALTYLAAQVHDLSQVAKWAIVSGALTGGGLTILANAPNPAGFAILHSKFPDGLSMVKLLKAALIPTAVAFCCFYARLFIF